MIIRWLYYIYDDDYILILRRGILCYFICFVYIIVYNVGKKISERHVLQMFDYQIPKTINIYNILI